jgi:RHS repeat-associated protein
VAAPLPQVAIVEGDPQVVEHLATSIPPGRWSLEHWRDADPPSDAHADERGLTSTNLWDGLNRLIRVADARGFITNVYDRLNLVSVVDRMGFSTKYEYNGFRQVLRTISANNRTNSYNYCTCGSLESSTDPGGNSTLFFYDNAGRLLETIYPDQYRVTNIFDLHGNLIKTVDSSGSAVTNWFNNQGLKYAVQNAAGYTSYIVFDKEDHVATNYDANGVPVVSTYDKLGRVLSRSYPDTGTETFGYSAAGLIAYTNQLGLITRYTYDEAGRKTAETNANQETIRFTYNAASDLLTLTDGKNQVTTWNYDGFGRLTNKLDQSSVEILRYAYDANDRLTNRWSNEKLDTRYAFDPAGNLTNISYNASGTVRFGYDALNRVTNMVDAIGTTRYSYDTMGRPLTEDGPFDDDTLTNSYSNGLRTGLTLQQPTDFWWTSFGYDATRRLSTVTSPAGTFTYTYSRVDNAFAGKLTGQIALPNGSAINNAFDSSARLRSTALITSGNTTLDSSAYGYNVGNQRTTFTNAAGTYVSFAYDPISQLTNGDSSINTEDRRYSYDHAWNLSSRVRNATTDSFTVDGKNQLSAEPAGSCSYDSNGNLTNDAGHVLVYDDENRLIEWRQTSSPTSGSKASTFAYDGMGRLRTRGEFLGDGSTWVLQGAVNYIYDGFRVIQERDTNNWPQVAYTRGNDLSGTMQGAGGIGGLLARSHDFTTCTNTITYHLDNNSGYCLYDLAIWGDGADISGESIDNGAYGEYTFNAVGGHTYNLHAWSCDLYFIQVFQDSFPATLSIRTVNFLAGEDSKSAEVSESGLPVCDAGHSGAWLTHNYYHADGNGNITALESTAETLTASYRYDPYGNITSQSGGLADANVYRFSSKEFHEASGMYYYLYRFYSPALQRWISGDPIGEAGFEAIRQHSAGIIMGHAPNWYVFVHNNSISEIDPLGLADLTEQEILRMLNQLRNQLNNKNPPGSEGEKALNEEINKWLDRLNRLKNNPPKCEPKKPWFKRIPYKAIGEGALDALDRLSRLPFLILDPCIANPYLPGCGGGRRET